jgi:hypothetical protein
MEEIKIQIQYTADDLQKSYELFYKKVYSIRAFLLLYIGIISLLGGTFFLLQSLYYGFSNTVAWFLIFYGLLLIIYFYWRLKTIGKRMFKKMHDFKSPYDYTFNEEGFIGIGKDLKSEAKWCHFKKYIISENLIILCPNKFRFNFFPKKYFSEEQYMQLQEWIKAKINNTEKL